MREDRGNKKFVEYLIRETEQEEQEHAPEWVEQRKKVTRLHSNRLDILKELEKIVEKSNPQSYERAARILPSLIVNKGLSKPGIYIDPDDEHSILIQWPSLRIWIYVEPEIFGIDWLSPDQKLSEKAQNREMYSEQELYDCISEILKKNIP